MKNSFSLRIRQAWPLMSVLLLLNVLVFSRETYADVQDKGKGVNPNNPREVTAINYTTINGNILSRIHIGEEMSFQVYHSTVPGSGQIYPSGLNSPADMGIFVRTGGVLYAPNFGQHGGTATGGLGTYTAWTPVSLSAVSGTGTLADPFSVTVVCAAGTSGLRLTMVATYVNGDNYFRHDLKFSNVSSQTISFNIFLGSDIYLANSDAGIPTLYDATTKTVGGKDCPTQTYNIFHIPITPANYYTARGYNQVWTEIGSGNNLSGTIAVGCQDNGAAVQWANKTLASGATLTIKAATSFGQIPEIAGCETAERTTNAPVSRVQRWYIPTAPNIQGLVTEEDPDKLPMNTWFTEMDQAKLGRLEMPKDVASCELARLKEWNLSRIDTIINARPFKITYYRKSIKTQNAKMTVWYTDVDRKTVNGLSTTTNTNYAYTPFDSIYYPWDIQVQGAVNVKYKEPGSGTLVSIRSNPKLWFSALPKTNHIYALDPTSGAATLETYTVPYGNVDAFFVDAVLPGKVEYIWIAASENGNAYYYRMPATGGTSLMWAVADSVSDFNSLRTLHLTKKLKYAGQLPYQLWASSNTSDQHGLVRILKFNTALINTNTVDTICAMPKRHYEGPNGLFTPPSKNSISLNRMFMTEGLQTNDMMSSNRATPSDTVWRQTVNIPQSTKPLTPVAKTVPVTSMYVKPLCEILNWTPCAKHCVVEQYKAPIPPAVYDFSSANLDIDMSGSYATLKGSGLIDHYEQFNFAFHEPRPGDYGLVGRMSYKAGIPLAFPPCDTCIFPIQNFNGELDEAGPKEFNLADAYPNPFNPVTTIAFTLPQDAFVTLKVYNTLGQEVAVLNDHALITRGYHEATFDAGALTSGVYFYQITAQGFSDAETGAAGKMYHETKKMLLMR